MQVIITEASKAIREVGRTWKPVIPIVEGENMVRTESLTASPGLMRSPAQSWKVEIMLLIHAQISVNHLERDYVIVEDASILSSVIQVKWYNS